MGAIYCYRCGYLIGDDDSDYDSSSLCSSCASKEENEQLQIEEANAYEDTRK